MSRELHFRIDGLAVVTAPLPVDGTTFAGAVDAALSEAGIPQGAVRPADVDLLTSSEGMASMEIVREGSLLWLGLVEPIEVDPGDDVAE